jgi:hypothetical protein
MPYKSEELINPHGRRVRVAGHRVEYLLGQGFERVPDEPEDTGTDEGEDTGADEGDALAEGRLDDLSKSDLWALVKERELDDGVEWSSSSKDDLIAVLRGE